MRYLNNDTGEIIDLTPYRVTLARQVAGPARSRHRNQAFNRKAYHLRLSWGFWVRTFVDQLGPTLLLLIILAVLVTLRMPAL
jgi:hypothetical protein